MPECDPATLIAFGACVNRCLESGQMQSVKTSLLGEIEGDTDVANLLEEASCFTCLTRPQLRAIRVWLLADLGAIEQTPQAIMDATCCLIDCMTIDQAFAAQVAILAELNGYDPNDVGSFFSQANCFLSCLSGIQQEAIQTYLIALSAGASTDPIVLFSQASCIQQCMSSGQSIMAETAMICAWSDNFGGTFFRITQDGDFRITQDGDRRVWRH